MTIDVEGDLRREFDAARPPSGLTFSAESVLRQGSRINRRRRMVAAGSAAMAVGLVAVAATVMTRPHDTAAPQPATHTATTGLVRAQLDGSSWITSFQVEFNRDAGVRSDVSFSAVGEDGKRHALGAPSNGKPGQTPGTTWRSGMLDGHPYTVGVVPGTSPDVSFAGGASYAFSSNEVPGTGYTIFSVDYQNTGKEPARPAQIATISWDGPAGIVDGIEGDHRLSGRILRFDSAISEKLVIGPGRSGQTTISGETRLRTSDGGYSTLPTVATTDASGVAVVTGRYPVVRVATPFPVMSADGAPIAAGILPSGAANIGVILTKGEALNPVVVLESLPDGRVIFAVTAEHPSVPSKDSIKAVTWTNADGSQGRKDVTQH